MSFAVILNTPDLNVPPRILHVIPAIRTGIGLEFANPVANGYRNHLTVEAAVDRTAGGLPTTCTATTMSRTSINKVIYVHLPDTLHLLYLVLLLKLR